MLGYLDSNQEQKNGYSPRSCLERSSLPRPRKPRKIKLSGD
jgi:hypothetical protein